MTKADTTLPQESDPRLKAMISDSIQMLDELSKLTVRLTNASETAAERSAVEGAAQADDLGQMERDLKGLQERLAQLSSQIKSAAQGLDQQLRQSPYLFAAAALGLGFLLGKARRL